jgi:hypothetical protein
LPYTLSGELISNDFHWNPLTHDLDLEH